ncbi:MAG: hypothetical protein HYV27_03085 [Candidatus Hydrogenedentes bacterium]|nr:hypothetical protein [Candidatus Hydrogenedentota bacterium]
MRTGIRLLDDLNALAHIGSEPYIERAMEEMQRWRVRLVDLILLAVAVVIPVVYVPLWFLGGGVWNDPPVVFFAALYGCFLALTWMPRRMQRWRAEALLGLGYVTCLAILLGLGPFGVGMVGLFALPVLACLVSGFRTALAVLAANAVTMGAICAALLSGQFSVRVIEPDTLRWSLTAGALFLLDMMITLCLGVLLLTLARALAREKAAVERLAEEQVELLEAMTHQRTATASHREVAERLSRHVEMERLVKEISADLSQRGIEDLNEGIQEALGWLGAFVHADRAFISMLSEEAVAIDENFEWCAPGIDGQAAMMEGVPIDIFPDALELLTKGEVFQVDDVSAMPDTMVNEKRLLSAQGVRATLNMPFVGAARVYGFTGFDMVRETRAWGEDDRSVLIMASEVFARVLQRKHNETKQRRLEQQVQQAQKLESLGALAGGIAHDFNNLLMGIQGHAELLREETMLAPGAGPHLSEILHATEKAAELCRKMLAYAGDTRSALEAVSLNDVCTAAALSETMPERVKIEWGLEPSLPPVRADARQLEQVTRSLLTNAVESLGAHGGRIRLSTGGAHLLARDLERAYFRDRIRVGWYAYLEVMDTGEGMSDETRRRLFEPFFSTRFPGRGLGMAALLGIIRNHHGAVTIRSAPGSGSAIRIYIPSDSDRNPGAGQELSPGLGAPCKVLLMMEESLGSAIIESLLAAAGIGVERLAAGAEGMRYLETCGVQPHVVVMDHDVQTKEGLGTYACLRERWAGLPVLLVDAGPNRPWPAGIECDEHCRVLVKPWTAQQLRQQLHWLLRRDLA